MLRDTLPVYIWRNVTATTVRLFSHGKNESSDEEQKETFKSASQTPERKLTRYQMDYLRSLRVDFPDLWPLRKLAKHFRISYPAVVKILKSKFQPSEEVAERQDKRTIELRNKARFSVNKTHIKEEKRRLMARIKHSSVRNQGVQTKQTEHSAQSQTKLRPQSQTEHSHRPKSQLRSQSQTELGSQCKNELRPRSQQIEHRPQNEANNSQQTIQ